MSKRLVHSLEGLVTAMFKDIAPTYSSGREWKRDLNRSLHELGVRGERFLTIDLPAIRKHLDKCLDDGLYVPVGLYLTAQVSRKVVVPAFGRDLYLQIFHQDGKLRLDPNPYAIADLRQLYECLGKLKHPCKEEAIDEEVKNFLAIETELRRPRLSWEGDHLYEGDFAKYSLDFADACISHQRGDYLSLLDDDDFQSLSRGDADTLGKVCDILSVQFGDLHLEREGDYAELPQHGTGRVSNLAKTESKFDFSCWPNKLNHIFPYDRYATTDFGQYAYFDDSLTFANHEHSSKLIAVPKTMSGPRLIASEPNYHQWVQQLIRNQLENRIKRTSLRYSVSFGDQEPNRKLALQGSIDGTLATVDLKSASDRLSCWTVERVFRKNLTILERVHASRTRVMRNAINDSFSQILLKKCFTQGSACTFPVQTIVYSMLCIAAVIMTRGLRINTKSVNSVARQVRVFGDDLIVPSDSLPKLQEILSYLQLRVNPNKTFSKGKFRESCGLDVFDGVDVTPARIKRISSNPSHETALSMLESANNLFRRGMWHTSEWVMTHLRKFDFPIVAFHDSAGIPSSCGSSFTHLQSRWNKRLHRTEYRVHQLTNKSQKVATQSAHDLYEYLFKRTPQGVHHLDYLAPVEGALGIVNKNASVMKRGWVFLD